MNIAEIRELPLNEKFQLMEALWEDLRSHVRDLPIPEWHKQLLDDRRKAVEEGREEILEWDNVKNSLGNKNA